MKKWKLPGCAALLGIFWLPMAEAASTNVVGNVRVQTLSPTLVRLEVRGPGGFEDRLTYHVVNRNWSGVDGTVATNGNAVLITTTNLVVSVPTNATSLSGITIRDSNSNLLWSYTSLPSNRISLPEPTNNVIAWAIADTPRMVPASWGYNPAPTNSANYSSNGWDLTNNAADVYVFLPQGNVRQLRADFITLTGPTQMLPLRALGAWDCRYYAYSEETALMQIQNYRRHNFPLDILAIDTDWRVGGSTGYDVNTGLFPDLNRFFSAAHASNVWVVFNDHPAPQSSALNPVEVTFRNNGLRGILGQGLDFWWYDRNWSAATLPSPAGFTATEWGMYVYNWIMSDFYPGRRPLILANLDNVNNGTWGGSSQIASHRYGVQWTGDISTGFSPLQQEIQTAINEGIYSAFPYTSADLGGRYSDPTAENYVRWIQYGVLSPIVRPHCSNTEPLRGRMPWLWGETAERIARDYYNLRYRLLPYLYQLSRHNYETADPLLKRCDFNYPAYSQARATDQYLLGDHVLVAPVITAASSEMVVPGGWLTTTSGQPGVEGSYYSNTNLAGAPTLTRTDAQINFTWNSGSPGGGVPSTYFTARWTGNVTIGGNSIGQLAVRSDDGVRLYVDGVKVADNWGPQNSNYVASTAYLTPQTTHAITLEYLQLAGNDLCRLIWQPASSDLLARTAQRNVWIPPGDWIDAWTGTVYAGPQTITTASYLDATPIYIAAGTIIPLAPQMSYTGQLPWDPVALDIYPDPSAPATNSLYEDDNVSSGYQTGEYRTTATTATADASAKTVTVEIMPAQGTFTGAASTRGWNVRIHQPLGFSNNVVTSVIVDGSAATWSRFSRNGNQTPFQYEGSAPDSDVIVVPITSASVATQHVVVVNYGSPLGAVPPPPTGLSAAGGIAQVSLSWHPVPGATSYNVKRSIVSGAETIIATPAATNYNDAGLDAGTIYYYVVSAVNGNGEGDNSSEVSASLQVLQPLLYEGFSGYSAGNLPGQSFKGLGFTTNVGWAGLNGSFAGSVSDAAQVTAANGLTFSKLASAGGKATVKGDSSNTRARPDLSTNGPFAAAGLLDLVSGTIGGGNINGTLYVSFLFRPVSTDRNSEYGGLHLARADNDQTGVIIGNSYNAWAYSLAAPGVTLSHDLKSNLGAGGYNHMDNSTRLFVCRLDYVANSNDTITVWVDPNPAGDEDNQISDTTYVGSISGDFSFDRFFLRGGNATHQFDFDEIRFGTTWPSVLPSGNVPTPVISASAGNNGSITPSGAVTVSPGNNQGFTITANSGCHITDVLVNGNSVGAVSSYTFTNVTANHSLSASFVSNLSPFPITASVTSSNIQLSFPTVNNQTYVVLQADALNAPVIWQTNSVVLGDGTVKSVYDSIGAIQRFYRVVTQP